MDIVFNPKLEPEHIGFIISDFNSFYAQHGQYMAVSDDCVMDENIFRFFVTPSNALAFNDPKRIGTKCVIFAYTEKFSLVMFDDETFSFYRNQDLENYSNDADPSLVASIFESAR
ncbi:hypothetical protein KAZ66_00205 [Candidatus Woesebacteria bacterium]|nr:hypothetical protein [Candidatus Woesebacteria bacterium]